MLMMILPALKDDTVAPPTRATGGLAESAECTVDTERSAAVLVEIKPRSKDGRRGAQLESGIIFAWYYRSVSHLLVCRAHSLNATVSRFVVVVVRYDMDVVVVVVSKANFQRFFVKNKCRLPK
jgi:hypothetical protein